MISRRDFVLSAAAGGLAATAWRMGVPQAFAAIPGGEPPGEPASLPAGAAEEAILDTLPGKRPLIKRAFRAPNYETPIEYFNQPMTPNDAFFVRYHLSDIPQVQAAEWRLRISGPSIARPMELTLDDLKRGFPQAEVIAVCQCSGNRRGFSQPHVPGVEWGHGAMGNARWTGVRLKDVLDKAGLDKDALEIVLNGADGPAVDKTPDFIKSLPVWKAMDENTLIAFAMNGQDLPHWNGFPARVIVPGWTATYWMKHVVDIQAQPKPFGGFWMANAYRIPTLKFPVAQRFVSQENETSTPITEMVVNSVITNLRSGAHLRAGRPLDVHGVAWDGGYGIHRVEVSADGGQNWSDAKLGPEMGRYAWRQWQFAYAPKPGRHVIMARATNRIGQTQVSELIWNAAGYHNNVMQRIAVTAA